MTTEGMPEHVKAWLMERLEGMKHTGGDTGDLDLDIENEYRNKTIDAVIAMVREG